MAAEITFTNIEEELAACAAKIKSLVHVQTDIACHCEIVVNPRKEKTAVLYSVNLLQDKELYQGIGETIWSAASTALSRMVKENPAVATAAIAAVMEPPVVLGPRGESGGE